MKAFWSSLLILLIISLASAEEFSLQATVTVNPPPIELIVNSTILTKEVEQGKDLLFLVELSKKALDEITVDLKYEIIKKKGIKEEIIASKVDSMQLINYASKEAAIKVPSGAKPGEYYLRVTATYFNQSDIDEDSFFVKRAKPVKPGVFLQALFFLFGWFI